MATQRAAELAYAVRNTRALRRRGGVEYGARQYPLFVALHAAWMISMLLLVPARTWPNWYLIGAYALLQPMRLWVLATLGSRWTTRVIVLPNTPPVRTGPYRFLSHPNYAIVVLEIALLPLAFRAYAIAAVFSLLNAALIAWRIRIEGAALAASPRNS